MSEAKLKEEIDGSIYMALKGDLTVTFTTPTITGINMATQEAAPHSLNLIEKLKPMKMQSLLIKLVSWKEADFIYQQPSFFLSFFLSLISCHLQLWSALF